MAIFFRITSPASEVGTLYDRHFEEAPEGSNSHDDLVITTTHQQFSQIVLSNPSHIILRVHEDRYNRDISQGSLYDENFEPMDLSTPLKVSGNPVLFTVTPDEFDAVRLTH